MLSYRHSFHAGNFADVLKHIVLLEITSHLLKKDKPFDYIDTHAGAGMYDLHSYEACKLGEFKRGVGLLNSLDYPELANYFELIETVNRTPGKLENYPGSPFFALSVMRAEDRAHLYELHAKDYTLLKKLISTENQFAADAQVHHKDGYAGLLQTLPPASRRALVLIDPSYEVKSEYQTMIDALIRAHKKFATGIYAIWYPVVDRARITQVDNILYKSGIKDIQRFELSLSEDSDEKGMTASGLWVINPPWGLLNKMQSILPKLKRDLTVETNKRSKASYRCEVLVKE
ncbi:UNVERIFIED_CONTAM: hypothetical protein GTU68_027642 [Idotea baltica]|nr:hypothetical protein [Idotea baltica]